MDVQLFSFGFLLAVYGQVVLYRVSLREAIKAYAFLAFFYLAVMMFLQGIFIFCQKAGIRYLEFPLFALSGLVLLNRVLIKTPQFDPKYPKCPPFYLFSGLTIGLIWYGHLSTQSLVNARENIIEAVFWSLFSALMFPVIAGIKEKLELSDSPSEISIQTLTLLAVSVLILVFSFF